MGNMENYCFILLTTKWRSIGSPFTQDPCFLYLKGKVEVTETIVLPGLQTALQQALNIGG
jgi:hypothetical protein